jgi:hypothetical protein
MRSIPLVTLSMVVVALALLTGYRLGSSRSHNETMATVIEQLVNRKEYATILDHVGSVVGISRQFTLGSAASISNMIAVMDKEEHAIVYNPVWLSELPKTTGTFWTVPLALAHEVYHRLTGGASHGVSSFYCPGCPKGFTYKVERPEPTYTRTQEEREADEFSGFVLQRLGAPLSELTRVFSDSAFTKDVEYSRTQAVATGWRQAKDLRIP